MTPQDYLNLYIDTLALVVGLARYVITHFLSEIKRLNARVE